MMNTLKESCGQANMLLMWTTAVMMKALNTRMNDDGQCVEADGLPSKVPISDYNDDKHVDLMMKAFITICRDDNNDLNISTELSTSRVPMYDEEK